MCCFFFFLLILGVAYLWTLDCVVEEGRCSRLQKVCEHIVRILKSVCLLMIVCVCVGERGQCVSQSNLHWFPIHVW